MLWTPCSEAALLFTAFASSVSLAVGASRIPSPGWRPYGVRKVSATAGRPHTATQHDSAASTRQAAHAAPWVALANKRRKPQGASRPSSARDRAAGLVWLAAEKESVKDAEQLAPRLFKGACGQAGA